MSTEAMKLARDALGLYARTLAPTETQKKGIKAITALDEALAQPQQEPVLMFYEREWQGKTSREYQWLIDPFSLPAGAKLYTSPPARKPLTDEEIETVWRSVQANDFHDCVKPFARAIEAAHNIKENT